MNQRLWERIATVETALWFQNRQVVIVRSDTESLESFDEKIERWKAGEAVEGIKDAYEGGEVQLIWVRSVAPRARDVEGSG